MPAHTDFKFHPRVTQIGYYWGEDGHAEVYLLEGERLALIDTGTAGTPEKYLAPALETAGYRLSDVALILNTHGHYDHVSGNQAVVDASGAEVWLSPDDADIARDFELQFSRYFADRDRLAGRPDRFAQAQAEIRSYTASTPVDHPLLDGQRIDLGRGIQLDVIAAPGHSPGCLVFYWEREGMLFTGDSMVGAGSRVGGLPWIFFPDRYARSMERLLDLDIRTLCLGHHYFTLTQTRASVKYGEACRQFIAESRQVLQILEDALRAALEPDPQAALPDVIRRALPQIGRTLTVTVDEPSGLPFRIGGAGTLRAVWEQLCHPAPANEEAR